MNSGFGQNFDRAARAWDAMSPPEPVEHDLDAAVPCFCGGKAASIGVGTPNARLTCSSRRCGRQTKPGLSLENAVAAWNQSVREDQCTMHSWFVVVGDPNLFRCPHCDAEKNLGSARA